MTNRPTRRQLLGWGVAGVASGVAGCSQAPSNQTTASTSAAGTQPPDNGSAETPESTPLETVALETLATGFDAPVAIEFTTDGERAYIADQVGRIAVYESGSLRDEPALDLGDSVEFGGEKGLLGLALHPDFAENRRLYVRYSAPRRSGTPSNYSHTFVLAEFRATDDGRRIARDSERTILEIPQPQGNHNAGDVAFGPDGYLYVAVGDGGAGGDQGNGHVSDWYDAVGGGNGQDVTENLLGSILRLDVDGRDGDRPYAIPEDNPLVGQDGLDEHYAWGFRNPWRFSFDEDSLLVGDVGQNEYEEIDRVERGGNYGWNVREGAHCYGASECPSETPDDVRGGEPLVDPVVEYPHSGDGVSGISVIGGYVYRGAELAGGQGTYLFGDLQLRGRLFAATPAPDGSQSQWSTRVVDIAEGDSETLDQLLSFGRDPTGELYVLGVGPEGGGVHRLVSA
ncbi:PQQ-dependent sugar dehydrogenase [Halogranum rubrum]|uniref:Protein up-regulated by thyroid hormone-putative PQQ-dependent glucose dehydrogenase n=1 Tax=Halogranum salarium B-1 TaxID=1210908 RepID=J2ZBM5_9EURY|nr:PQQ-dependent sugar dehydrogenase [Halogranum salarium]EJN58070.1 protein up-regulated by thyroid hormone-putative PQQ-dependent glucose dehydrogenase [Halogranum salarium B-1]